MIDGDMGIYFYNPQTWNMTWLQPDKTNLCGDCSKHFAMARLNEDLVCRCESCFNKKALNMLDECLTPAEITFKLFHGEREKEPLFALLKETNWMEYTMEKENRLETLEEEQKRELLEAEMARRELNSLGGKRVTFCEVRVRVLGLGLGLVIMPKP
jgi:hypothetical protein